MKFFNRVKKKNNENEDPNVRYTDNYPVGMSVKDHESGITYIGTSGRFIKGNDKQTTNNGIIILEER